MVEINYTTLICIFNSNLAVKSSIIHIIFILFLNQDEY